MTIHVLVAFEDGTVFEHDFPNHELDDVLVMVKETEESLICRVEVENQKQNILYQYKRYRELTY